MNINISKKSTLTGHKGPIYALAQGRESHIIYSCSNDLLIVEWNLKNPEHPKAICKIPSKAFSFIYSSTLNHLMIGTFKGMLRIVDLNINNEIKCIEFKQGIIYKVAIDKNKNRLLVLTEAGILNVLNANNYEVQKQVNVSESKIRSIYMSNDSTYYLIGSGEGRIYKVNAESFNIEEMYSDHANDFGVNTMIRVEDTIISGARDAHLIVRNLNQLPTVVKKIPAHNFAVYDLKQNPSSTLFASCSRDKTIKIWESQSLNLLKRIDFKSNASHTHSVNCLIWNDWGLISGSDDGKIMVWDILEDL